MFRAQANSDIAMAIRILGLSVSHLFGRAA
jgi:hypothetical protein